MIWKLLKRNISFWQISGYAIATLIGLTIVMTAVQFYGDLRTALETPADGEISIAPGQNLVISKPVSLGATFSGEAPTFSDDEIGEIEAQAWSGRVARFQAADFSVFAGVNFGGRGLTTALFFESVPDDLVDIDPDDWFFDPAEPMIPIVISKDYLSLYNFGFAASGRMPVVSESIIKSVPLSVTLTGNGRRETFSARIVGFSSWLNTIAVPQSFMDWAHASFGTGENAGPSRLIVEVEDISDPEANKFMEDRNYEIAGPDNSLGRTAFILNLITSVVIAIGVVITLLALFILVLSLYLLIQKNRKTVSGLLLLGYTPAAVSQSYMLLVAAVNLAVMILASVAVFVAHEYWGKMFESSDYDIGSISNVLLLGAGLIILITLINWGVIRRLVRRNFR